MINQPHQVSLTYLLTYLHTCLAASPSVKKSMGVFSNELDLPTYIPRPDPDPLTYLPTYLRGGIPIRQEINRGVLQGGELVQPHRSADRLRSQVGCTEVG